jgi:tetratricopeptide (TPR) repeat protein
MAGAYSSNARCHADRDDEPGSLSPLRKAVEAWRVSTRAAPADELELALFIDGLATLAEAELSEGDPRAAWPLFSEAIAKLRPRAFGPRDPDGIEAGRLAELEERLARGLAHDEQLSRADAEYLRAIAIRERLDRLPDPRGRRFDDLTDLLWEYGEFQAQAGRSPAAATTLKRSVEVSRLAASRSSPRQAAARESYGQRLGEYGAWLVSRNDLAGAAIAFRLRIDLVRELLTIEKAGIIPSDLAEAYVALSAVEVKLGKQDDALAGYRAAFDILSQEAAARGYRKSLRRDLNAAFDGLTSLYLARSSVIDLGAISASVLPIREQYFARYADDEGIRADLAVTLLTLGIVKRATGALPAAKDYLARCVMLAAQSILTGDSRKAIDAIGAACQAQLTPPAAGAPG